MKRKILVLFMLGMVAGSVQAQPKPKQEAVPDSEIQKTVVTDTIRKAAVAPVVINTDSLKNLKVIDSLNTQLVLYKNFYAYISNKFFPEKYKKTEIEKAIILADSLSAARDSKWRGI